MKKEKREHKRVKFKNHVNLIGEGRKINARAVNVSQKGMFLSTNVFNVGDELAAIFSVLLNIPFKKDSVVVRKNINGIGIQFLN